MEKNPLEDSIRAEAENTIHAIRERGNSEIRRLDEAFASEIEEFRKKINRDSDARIGLELTRLENKGALELRKVRLRRLEGFIGEILDETVQGMRKTPKYTEFLSASVRDAMGRIAGMAEVCLKKEDLVLGQEIKEAIRSSCRDREITVKEDPAITWGGCTIHDDRGGRIFNSTLERICFRKSTRIRYEVMKALGEKCCASGMGDTGMLPVR